MNTPVPWPSAIDYIGALQHPQLVFRHAPLRSATFDLDEWGAPDAATGTNAAVFRATVGGVPTAIRCFTSSAGLSRDRYDTLAAHRRTSDVPSAADTRWTEEAVTVNRHVWPIVQMEWVDGRTLDEYLKFLCEQQPAALGELAERWRAVLVELAAAEVAHGDLQHGNVLVDQETRLRLVDLDGVWVSSGHAGAPPEENGHPAYRHPEHVGPQFWGPLMDAFPGLLIYTSIRALDVEPDLWQKYNNGANLLFAPEDLQRPGGTPIWDDLRRLRKDDVTNLAERLATCCRPGWVPDATADRLVNGDRPSAAPRGASSAIPMPPAPVEEELWEMKPVQATPTPPPTTMPKPPAPDVHKPSTSAPPPPTQAPGTSWFDKEAAATTPKPSPTPEGTTRSPEPVEATPEPTGRQRGVGDVIGRVIFLVIAALFLIGLLQGR